MTSSFSEKAEEGEPEEDEEELVVVVFAVIEIQ